MKILITGISSFIGRHFASLVSNKDLEITATYFSENDVIKNMKKWPIAPTLIKLDLSSPNDYHSLPKSIDVVIHIAGISRMDGYTIENMLQCNVLGTHYVHQYAISASAKCFIYMSSLSVHGSITVPIVDIRTPIKDPDTYGASKYVGERLVALNADRLPAAAVRLPGVLGKGARKAWIPTLLNSLLNHQDITIFNPNSYFNNSVHVTDLMTFIIELISNRFSGFHAFPVASKGETTIIKVVEFLKESTGSYSKIIIKPSSVNSFTISSQYAMEKFGFKPKEITETLNHYIADVI